MIDPYPNITLNEWKISLQKARTSNYRNEAAKILNNMGKKCASEGKLKQSIKYHLEEINESSSDPIGCATAHLEVGLRYQALGELEKAIQYHKEHLNISLNAIEDTKESKIQEQNALCNIGLTFLDKAREFRLKDIPCEPETEQAQNFLERSLSAAQSSTLGKYCSISKIESMTIDAHTNLGTLYDECGDSQKALEHFKAAILVYERSHGHKYNPLSKEQKIRLSQIHSGIGLASLNLGDYTTAEKYLQMDIALNNSNNQFDHGKTYTNMGSYHMKKHEWDKALECFQRHYTIAKRFLTDNSNIKLAEDNISIVKESKKISEDIHDKELMYNELERNNKRDITSKLLSDMNDPIDKKIAILQELIEDCSQIGHHSKKIHYLRKLLVIFQSRHDIHMELYYKDSDQLIANIYHDLGEEYNALNDYKEALACHTTEYNIMKKIQDIEGQAVAKINIFNALDGMNENINTILIPIAQEALSLAKASNKNHLVLLALQNLYFLYHTNFNQPLAQECIQDIIKLRENKESNEITSYINNIDSKEIINNEVIDNITPTNNSINEDQEIVKEEIDSNTTTLITKQSTSNHQNKSNLTRKKLKRLSNQDIHLENISNEHKFVQDEFCILENENDINNRENFKQWESFDNNTLLQKAAFAQKKGDLKKWGEIFHILGCRKMREGNPEKAISYHKKHLSAQYKRKNFITPHSQLTVCYLALNYFDDALFHAKEHLQIATEFNLKDEIQCAHSDLSHIHLNFAKHSHKRSLIQTHTIEALKEAKHALQYALELENSDLEKDALIFLKSVEKFQKTSRKMNIHYEI